MAKAKRRYEPLTERPGAVIGPSPLRGSPADLWLFVAVVAGTLLLFTPTLANGFVKYDDDQYVTANGVVLRGLTFSGIGWASTATHAAQWHPVTWLSHMLDVTLFGDKAGGHHLTSVALHAVNAGLVFALLRRLTGARWRPLAAAALFAIHPLRVESVAWVAERKDVLSALFFLLACRAYAGYARRTAGAPGRRAYVTALALFALGLMSNPIVLTLPAVLLLLDWWPLRRLAAGTSGAGDLPQDLAAPPAPAPAVGRVLAEKVPFAALSVVGWWTVLLQGGGGATQLTETLTLGQRLGNAVVGVPRYLGKIVWPADLSVLYLHPGSWPAWAVAASAGVVGGLTVAAVMLRRRAPYVALGWFWFLVVLAPASGVVQAGLQSIADRYTYLPGIGLAVAAAWGAAAASRRWQPGRRRWAARLAVVTGVALAVVTVRQQLVWRDTSTLFGRALAVDGGNWLALSYVGSELAERGDNDAAVDHLARAIARRPDFAEAHYNLGNAYLRRFLVARDRRASGAELAGYGNQAAAEYAAAVEHRPTLAAAHYNWGVVVRRLGDPAAAATKYERALAMAPAAATWRAEYAGALADLGRWDDAERQARQALRDDPENAEAKAALARVWSMAKGPPTAPATAPSR